MSLNKQFNLNSCYEYCSNCTIALLLLVRAYKEVNCCCCYGCSLSLFVCLALSRQCTCARSCARCYKNKVNVSVSCYYFICFWAGLFSLWL